MITLSPARELLSRDPAELLEDYAFRYGRSYDSYLATEPGRQWFWSRDRRGAAAFVAWGKYLHFGGGLLAPEEDKEELLGELVERAETCRQIFSFYNITDDDLPLFRRHGFQATKWGEEAIVDLADCTWDGKPYEWVRRQTNYCRRKGLTVMECRPDEMAPAEFDGVMRELAEVSAASLAAKPQICEVRFMEGSLDPQHLGRKRIFVARSADGAGRIEGFLVCNPGWDGRLWTFELYRHRPDAVRGAVAFLMHEAMQVLKAEGVEQVSLCLVPALGCNEPLPGDSALARRGLAFGSRYFNFLFNTAGVHHFKTRFRPRFENRYICVRPKLTLGSAWAFIRVLGVLHVDPLTLLRCACKPLAKRLQHRAADDAVAAPAVDTGTYPLV